LSHSDTYRRGWAKHKGGRESYYHKMEKKSVVPSNGAHQTLENKLVDRGYP